MSGKKSKKSEQKRTFKPRKTDSDKSEGGLKLYYGGRNNFAAYRKGLSIKCLMDYGDLAKLVLTGVYYTPNVIPLPDLARFETVLDRAVEEGESSSQGASTRSSSTRAPAAQEQVRGMSLAQKAEYDTIMLTYQEEVKARLRLILKMKDNRTNMFAFIMSTLSVDSEDALKQDDDYEEYAADNDPLRLWLAIVKWHQSGTTHQCAAIQKSEIRAQYYRMTQMSYETLITFKERFEDKKTAMELSENLVVDPAIAAMDFMAALDSVRYSEFKADVQNRMVIGDMEAPSTVTEIYRMVQQYVVPKHRGGNNSTSQGTIFATNQGDRVEKPKKDISHIECFNCHEMGHYASDCPAEESEEECDEVVTNKKNHSYIKPCNAQRAYVATDGNVHEDGIVILDNGADLSVIMPYLLSDVRKSRRSTPVNTLAGTEMSLELEGELDGFFPVKSSSDITVNILSFAEVEDKFDITYNPRESMVVHMKKRDVTFRRVRKLYVADMSDWIKAKPGIGLVTTVAERESGYSKREVTRAREARQLIENAGHVSQRDALEIVRGGNVQDVHVTADDVMRSFDIYGQSTAYVQGRTTAQKQASLHVDKSLRDSFKNEQDLHSDIMWANEQIYFISLSVNIGLMMCTAMPSTTTSEIGLALQGQINVLKSHGYNVGTVHMDPQRGVTSLKGQILGAVIDESGAGDHTPILDAKIRRLKEMIRSVLAALPWKCPRQMGPDVVSYSTTRHNIRPSTCNGSGVAPRVALTGMKPRYKKELSIAFGDYCECRDPTAKSNDASAKRTTPCIALYPVGNSKGSWVFLNIDTKRRVRRSQWKKMVTTQIIIDRMNEMAGDEETLATKRKLPKLMQQENISDLERMVNDEASEQRPTPPQEPPVVHPEAAAVPEDEPSLMIDDDDDDDDDGEPPVLVEDESDSDSDSDDEDDQHQDRGADDDEQHQDRGAEDDGQPQDRGAELPCTDETVEEQTDVTSDDKDDETVESEHPRGDGREPPRRSVRQRQQPNRYELYTALNILHISAQKGIRMFGKAADNAMVKEIKQLLLEKEAFHPVHKKSLSKRQLKKKIRSFMFLKPKYDAMAIFEKIKARLVANGSQQDKTIFDDLSSPTAAISSIFMVLATAAKERRKKATIDVTGAYLNAKMTGEMVVMELDALVASIVKRVAPDAEQYTDERGRMLVVLDKALYGCVQSAKLWYDNVSAHLRKTGYVPNDVDPCVMNKMVNGKQCTICLFVDDILVTCVDDAGIDELIAALKAEYGEITVHRDESDLSYLGMHLHSEGDKTNVSQLAYVMELLTEYQITGVAASPATGSLFEDDGTHALLSVKGMALFHTQVAQLLYLATRTRPDLLLSVSYLTTRVRAPNELDQKKLSRVFKYLNGTKEQVLVLGGASDLVIRAHIDAAFGLHGDARSHSGLVIKLGGSTVLCKSSKQKIMSKDSTEAELVALSDMVMQVLKAYEFMQSQGYGKNPPVLYQDNMSTISLVTAGGGKFRTKHMRVRREVVKEYVTNGDVRVVYRPTGQMLADSLTKPLQGTLLRGMTQGIVCNHHRCVTGVR